VQDFTILHANLRFLFFICDIHSQGNYQPLKISRNVHRKGCCGKDSDAGDSDSDDEEESPSEQVSVITTAQSSKKFRLAQYSTTESNGKNKILTDFKIKGVMFAQVH